MAVSEHTFRACVSRSYADDDTSGEQTPTLANQRWFSMDTRMSNADALPDTNRLFPKHSFTVAWISSVPLFPMFGSLHVSWHSLHPAEWPDVHIKLHCRPRSQTKLGTAYFEKKSACVSLGNGA